MSDKTEAPAKKAISKLPENILYKNTAKERVTKTSSEICATIVKMFSIEDLEDCTAMNAVSQMLVLALRASPEEPEFPEAFAELVDLKDNKGKNTLGAFVMAVAKKHLECKAEEEQEKMTAKQAKKDEIAKKKEEKDNEDKRFAQEQEEFGDLFIDTLKKVEKSASKFASTIITSATSKLPEKVSLAAGGMGVNIADGATKADIAATLAITLATLDGTKNAENAIQFMVGDLINQSISKGVFRNQSDAVSGIKHIIKDKAGKSYETTTLSQYALLSRRIPAEQRKIDVKPSLYLAAAKLTPPTRNKGDSKALPEEAMKKAVKDTDSFREELIEEINKGSLNTKTVAEKIDGFKKAQGWVKEETGINKADVTKALVTAAFAQFIIDNLLNPKTDKAVLARGKESAEYTSEQLGEYIDKAKELFQEAYISSEYNIEDLLAGFTKVTKNDKTKEVPYRLDDPFFVATKEAKEEKPLATPVETETEKEEEDDGGFSSAAGDEDED